MSREFDFRDWVGPARRRAAVGAALVWSPLVIVFAALAWRFAGVGVAIPTVLLGAGALGFVAMRLAERFDRVWLIRRLNALESELEDSAGLVFRDVELGALEQFQAERIAARVQQVDPRTLADHWSREWIAAAWVLGTVALAAILFWPTPARMAAPLSPVAQDAASAPGEPRLVGQQVRIVPPAYTGLSAQLSDSLDIRAPSGSRIEWAFEFSPRPESAFVQLVGGQSIPLELTEEVWEASLRLDAPALYRIAVQGMRSEQDAHRLEPIADEPPQVRVVEPASGLVMMRSGQRRWRIVFEASDDYGIERAGRLTVTSALGTGENISFAESSRTVTGSGEARRRRFAVDLDLAAYGLQPGSDLVAQLTVADMRSPAPYIVRGPGVILRWPAPAPAEVDGLELMAKQALPAYFRSQRQVIIDTEALISRRGNLSDAELLARSDAIGVDQRLLRLRYGQFVGMEVEEGPRPPPLPLAERGSSESSASADFDHHDVDGNDHGEERGDDHSGNHGDAPESPIFGSLGDVTAEFGHSHDDSEAATLLDPDTRELLRRALDEMWQAELNLRSGRPEEALPYELRALNFIKQVQQAARIYLPRIGSSQAPIEMSRRMTGKREGIVGGGAVLAPFAIEDAVPATAWRTLAGSERIDIDGLAGWVRSNSARIRDPLGVLAAIDAVRREPRARERRETLRGQLWVVLTRPPARVRRREDGGEMGRRYSQSLR